MSYRVNHPNDPYKTVNWEAPDYPSLVEVNEVAKNEFPEENIKDLVLEGGDEQDGFPVILSRANKYKVR